MCVDGEAVCDVCGKEKKRFGNGKIAKRCKECYRQKRQAKAGNYQCPECSQSFYAARQTKYCGKKCREQACRKSNWSTRVCEWCKKSFLAKTKTAKCCSQSCAGNKRNYAEKDSKRVKWERTCIGCGCVFRMKNGTRRKGLYCTRECAFAHGRMSPESAARRKEEDRARRTRLASDAVAEGAAIWMQGWRKCAWCNVSFWSRGNGVTCGSGCGHHAKQGLTRQCELCGQGINRRIEPGRRQCQECRTSAMKAQRERLKIQRRTRVETQWVEYVSRIVVFKRDRYQCWICLGMVKRKYDSNDPASPTIDHVVPLAKGGTHSYANCRTAHAICNSLKSDDV